MSERARAQGDAAGEAEERDGELLLLTGGEILELLTDRELEIVDAVQAAYERHAEGGSSLPHSSFLRFPGGGRERIIALPAYLAGGGGEGEKGAGIAGIKWIASFPGNLERGLDRASAAMIVNSAATGRPRAILEASVVSARRTAASAALAARELAGGGGRPERLGLVGCGLIACEIARFIKAVFGGLPPVTLFDLDPARADQLGGRLTEVLDAEVEVASGLPELLAACPLVAFATTAVEPHVESLDPCPRGATILHISLRDLVPELILAADNVVDDPDHICRAQTSVHLAEQQVGHRDFIRCSIADITAGRQPARPDPDKIAVYSPFGLGVLDLAVAGLAIEAARREGVGRSIEGFLPPSWVEWR